MTPEEEQHRATQAVVRKISDPVEQRGILEMLGLVTPKKPDKV